MKIAHLFWSFELGGAETMLVDIMNQQSLHHQVRLIVVNAQCNADLLRKLHPSIRVHCLDRPAGSRDPRHWLKLNTVLWTFAPDIVHAHQESLIKVCRHARSKKVLTVHDTRSEVTEAMQKYDAVFSISRAVQTDLGRRVPACRSTVIGNGVDCTAIRQRAASAGRPLRIVQVSRLLHEKKGQDILLRAIALVAAALGGDAVTLDLIGSGPSQAYLEALAMDLGIRQLCKFSGALPREQLYEQLCSYDLLVQPSRFEGFGLTIVEAMAADVAVLVSDIDGPAEIVQHGEHGYVFPSGDHTACAARIAMIIEHSSQPQFHLKLARARAYALENFDVRATAEKYLQEYRRILPEASRPELRGHSALQDER